MAEVWQTLVSEYTGDVC